MIVQNAQPEDYAAWLRLAGEVEDLFGPMVEVEAFQQTLMKNLRRGTALCVRDQDRPAGAELLGGLFYSPKPPLYKISWLAVRRTCRRQGIGLKLMEVFWERVVPPAEIMVTTFGAKMEGGEPAQRFYRKLGFHEAEVVYHDYRGKMEAYQVFRRTYGEAGQDSA
jgi:ribosomal protein S18 acetylase RimI-like enzyme